ncbi:MAG: hypothetical protein L6R00_04435 [Phycisphaerae bacterium]|nr:hypothetical protein [Phycisphaerae bacterium]
MSDGNGSPRIVFLIHVLSVRLTPWPVFSRPVFATGFNRWCSGCMDQFVFPSPSSRLQPVLLPEPVRLDACDSPEDREPSPAEAG